MPINRVRWMQAISNWYSDSDLDAKNVQRSLDAHVHGGVEYQQIDAGRQIAAPRAMPVPQAVNSRGFRPGQIPHVRSCGPAASPRGQGGDGDAEIGCSARVARVIDVATLAREYEIKAALEVAFHRFAPSPCTEFQSRNQHPGRS